MIDVKTIKLPTRFSKLEEQSKESRFIPVRIYIAHTGENLNNSIFSKEVLESMIPTLANIPILGYVNEDKNGKEDFKGHEKNVTISGASVNISYKTNAYGFVPEDNNAHFEITGGKEWLVADGYLWSRFVDAVKIFDESNGTKSQSMEVSHADGYTDKRGRVVFTSAQFEGLCILGDDVPPAMTGSVITTEFSKSKFKSAFKEMLAEFTAEKGEKALATKKKQEDEAVVVEPAKETTPNSSATSSKTEPAKSDVTSSASKPAEKPADKAEDKEKATPASEATDEKNDTPAETSDQSESTEENAEMSKKDEEAKDKDTKDGISLNKNESASKEDPEDSDENDEDADDDSDSKDKKAQFELSLSEQEAALMQAVREKFGQPFDWLSLEAAYKDYAIVRGFISSVANEFQYFRVGYSVNADDTIKLGDKTEVFPAFLTAQEKANVENKRVEIASLKDRLNELEAYKAGIEMSAKQDILEANINNLTQEQAEGIKAQFNTLSTEEVEKEVAYAIFTTNKTAMKNHKGMKAVSFSAKEDYGYGTANDLFRKA